MTWNSGVWRLTLTCLLEKYEVMLVKHKKTFLNTNFILFTFVLGDALRQFTVYSCVPRRLHGQTLSVHPLGYSLTCAVSDNILLSRCG